MANKPLPELEGKMVLLLREGKYHGVDLTGSNFDAAVQNSIEREHDIAFAPVEDKNLDVHSLERRIGATIPFSSIEQRTSKWGREVWGKLTQVSDWLRERASDRPWPYVSPTLHTLDGSSIVKNPHKAFIRSLSPTGTPAIAPQAAWLSDEGDDQEGLALSIEVDPQETTTSQEGTHIHLHIDGNGKWKPDTKKELTDMVDEKDKKDEVETPIPSPTVDLSDIEKRELKLADDEKKMAARQLELSKAKVQRFAEELTDKTKLHPKSKEAFVTRTMALNLDDIEADENGKTALDLELDYEMETRGASADFSDTAEIPEQDGGKKDKNAIDLSGMGAEDLELARANMTTTGVEYSDEAEEFDKLALSIQKELGGEDKCSLKKAQNLAYIKWQEREGD